jgi:hypothetical protein
MLKKMMIMLMVVCFVLSPLVTFAKKNDGAKVVLPNGQEIPLDGLSNGDVQNMMQYVNKIAEAQKQTLAEKAAPISEAVKTLDPEKIDSWRKVVTGTIKDICSDLNVTINEFIATPAGMLITGLVVYNLAGKDMIVQGKVLASDIMDVVLGIPFWCTMMLIIFYLRYKYLATFVIYKRIIEHRDNENKPDKITRVEKLEPKIAVKYPWQTKDARCTFAVVLYGSAAIITLFVTLLVFV